MFCGCGPYDLALKAHLCLSGICMVYVLHNFAPVGLRCAVFRSLLLGANRVEDCRCFARLLRI